MNTKPIAKLSPGARMVRQFSIRKSPTLRQPKSFDTNRTTTKKAKNSADLNAILANENSGIRSERNCLTHLPLHCGRLLLRSMNEACYPWLKRKEDEDRKTVKNGFSIATEGQSARKNHTCPTTHPTTQRKERFPANIQCHAQPSSIPNHLCARTSMPCFLPSTYQGAPHRECVQSAVCQPRLGKFNRSEILPQREKFG